MFLPDGDGSSRRLLKYEITAGIIRSAERMTYTNVNLVLEGDEGLRRRYEPLVAGFELMRELAKILIRKRGAVVRLISIYRSRKSHSDQFGRMVSIVRTERNIAHRLIEEFMLSAQRNRCAHFEHNEIRRFIAFIEMPIRRRSSTSRRSPPALVTAWDRPPAVRRFTPASPRRDRKRGGQAMSGGTAGEIQVSPRNYQRLSEQIAGTPVERILSFLMLRSLKQARYSRRIAGTLAWLRRSTRTSLRRSAGIPI